MSTLPVNPNRRSKIRMSPELIKKTDQILDQVSSNDLLDEQILEKTDQKLIKTIEQEFSPEQLQAIILQAPLMMAQIKLLMIKLQQNQLIDSKLAGLLCAALKEFDIAREQNGITQEKKEKLETILNLVKQKLTNLISNKQIEPLLAKPLILLLPIISVYIKTLNII